MIDLPHTLSPMLMRGNAMVLKNTCRKCPENQRSKTPVVVLGHPSSSALSTPPITSSRISTQQTTRHTRRGRAGARGTTSSRMTTGRAPELRPTKSACSGDAVLRTSTRVTVPMGQCAAPAPGAPSPWDSTLGNIEDSISQCTFLQMTYTAENPHADGSAAPKTIK